MRPDQGIHLRDPALVGGSPHGRRLDWQPVIEGKLPCQLRFGRYIIQKLNDERLDGRGLDRRLLGFGDGRETQRGTGQ